MMIKIALTILFFLGFIYLILPGPTTIDQFPKLPDSLKSQESGDTVQIPNVAAYFSDFRRPFVINFYTQAFKKTYCDSFFLGFPNPLCFIPPIHLNHPPEEAFTYIRDQQQSTYLEGFSYPLREEFYVNGYEPFDENGKPFTNLSIPMQVGNATFQSKTNLRLFTTSIYIRLLVYLLVWFFGFLILKLFKKAIKEKS